MVLRRRDDSLKRSTTRRRLPLFLLSLVCVDSREPPIRICILCEPSPLTYLSGQAGRFTALMEHLANAEDYRVSSNVTPPQDLDQAYIHLVTAESTHPNPPTTHQPLSHCKKNATTTPIIPVHYTRGLVLPNYAGLTVCVDWTCRVLRLLFPRTNRRFDLMHVSTPGFLVFPAILASRLYQIPLVMSYHTHLPVYMRSYFPAAPVLMEWILWRVVRFGHAFADLTLLPSPQLADQFRLHRIGRCHVWPKGIDTDRFHPRFRNAAMRLRMMGNCDNHGFLLVYIGRLAREKRLEDLKPVLEKLNHNSSIAFHLCIVGTGPHEQCLKKHFSSTPTTFLGRLDGLGLCQAFASGDVFCMPSDSETLGFVVLESMASGVPCVAVRAGGLADIIHHNRSGLLVDPGGTDDFAAGVKWLQESPGEHRRLAETGRQETQRWSWDASMRQIQEDIYPRARMNFANRPVQRFLKWSGAIWSGVQTQRTINFGLL